VVVERRREGDEDTAPTYRISEGGFTIKDRLVPMCQPEGQDIAQLQYYCTTVVVPRLSRYVQGLW
jgi:hypothetical protein